MVSISIVRAGVKAICSGVKKVVGKSAVVKQASKAVPNVPQALNKNLVNVVDKNGVTRVASNFGEEALSEIGMWPKKGLYAQIKLNPKTGEKTGLRTIISKGEEVTRHNFSSGKPVPTGNHKNIEISSFRMPTSGKTYFEIQTHTPKGVSSTYHVLNSKGTRLSSVAADEYKRTKGLLADIIIAGHNGYDSCLKPIESPFNKDIFKAVMNGRLA